MSEFWEAMRAGAVAGIGEMGEEVTVNGRAIRAVVSEARSREGIVAGGRDGGVNLVMQVSVEDGNASTGSTSGHEYSRSNGVKLPACNGDRIWHSVPELVPRARIPEEPGAVIPHAGICKGGVGQPASLP